MRVAAWAAASGESVLLQLGPDSPLAAAQAATLKMSLPPPLGGVDIFRSEEGGFKTEGIDGL